MALVPSPQPMRPPGPHCYAQQSFSCRGGSPKKKKGPNTAITSPPSPAQSDQSCAAWSHLRYPAPTSAATPSFATTSERRKQMQEECFRSMLAEQPAATFTRCLRTPAPVGRTCQIRYACDCGCRHRHGCPPHRAKDQTPQRPVFSGVHSARDRLAQLRLPTPPTHFHCPGRPLHAGWVSPTRPLQVPAIRRMQFLGTKPSIAQLFFVRGGGPNQLPNNVRFGLMYEWACL